MTTKKDDSQENARINMAVSKAREVLGGEKKVSVEKLQQIFQGFSQKERALINHMVLQNINRDIAGLNKSGSKNPMKNMRLNNQKTKLSKERERFMERQSLLADLTVKLNAERQKFDAQQIQQTADEIMKYMMRNQPKEVIKILEKMSPDMRAKISENVGDQIEQKPRGPAKSKLIEQYKAMADWIVKAMNASASEPISQDQARLQTGTPKFQPKP